MDESADAGIYARHSPYLERYVQIGVAGDRVLSISFPDQPDENAVEGDEANEHPLLDQLFEYLDGVNEVGFDDVQIALTVPTDQRDILETLRTIPYGESVDVETIARMTPDLNPEDDDDLITVRTALDKNPIPIVLPDHRVRNGPSAAPPGVEQKLRSLEGL
ncbi:MGMT family protein [Natrialbaceae archaeon A-CW2]